MASPDSLPDSVLQISGVIPLSQTLGLWQSLLTAAVLIAVSILICYYSAPDEQDARGMRAMGVTYEEQRSDPGKVEKPGEWLEYSPLLTILVCGLGVAYLAREVVISGPSILLELNHYIFAFLILGMGFHGRPRAFMRAIAGAVPAAAQCRRSPLLRRRPQAR